MNTSSLMQNTPAWNAFCWISFIIAVGFSLIGIALLPVEFWIRGYLIMGLFFTIGACFTLAKTMRDNFENKKLINRVQDAQTEKMLTDYETIG